MNNLASENPQTSANIDAPFWHRPVMSTEVVAMLRPASGRVFLDGTLGGGGHSGALLSAGARVVGVDRDPEALAEASSRLASYGENFRAVRGNFADAAELPPVLDSAPYDGAVLDLGVSSHQLDSAHRGFSFRHDGPLDMRMDPSLGASAADLVNTVEEGELARILREYGEEPQARRIARAIVAERNRLPFTRTGQLAALIEKVLGRRGRTHPATRSFQALRIAVNDELGSLRRALESIPGLLRAGARLVVITFHSLEDRLVKTFFRAGSEQWLDRPEWPAPQPNPGWRFRDLTRHPVEAGAEEVAVNPRARSARLRAVEILAMQQEVAA
ncbi:MAG: 16S rRNA (cytosine(1402)-N(4))-methyltransferase RsmH [Chthoniobacterales bacterium]|nr:16S rRNA (cytosine(1402)-N(4))-methyltransferase RsmH [Chthoniobacterales bacterium]